MGSGWRAPIQVTLCPIDSCYSLNRGIRHLERSFHLSSTQGGLSPPLTTLGDFQPLERIITPKRGLSPLTILGLSLPREDYHLSPCRFRTVTPICKEKWPAVHFWSTSSLTPFPHNSGLVTCFYLRGYGLRALILILVLTVSSKQKEKRSKAASLFDRCNDGDCSTLRLFFFGLKVNWFDTLTVKQ